MNTVTPKSDKNLIVCPVCESTGHKEVLAEIKGTVVEVMRFHKGITKVLSEEFSLECGRCHTIVFRRTKNVKTESQFDNRA